MSTACRISGVIETARLGLRRIARNIDHRVTPTRVIVAERNQMTHALPVHVGQRHGWAGLSQAPSTCASGIATARVHRAAEGSEFAVEFRREVRSRSAKEDEASSRGTEQGIRYERHVNRRKTIHADRPRTGRREINDSALDDGAAVIDPHHHAPPVTLVGYAHSRLQTTEAVLKKMNLVNQPGPPMTLGNMREQVLYAVKRPLCV
jgi:hypothetical protein